MVAHTLHTRGLCPHCGYPREVCRSEERFEAQKQYCYAKAAVETAEKDSRGGKDEEPGLLHIPVYVPPVEI